MSLKTMGLIGVIIVFLVVAIGIYLGNQDTSNKSQEPATNNPQLQVIEESVLSDYEYDEENYEQKRARAYSDMDKYFQNEGLKN